MAERIKNQRDEKEVKNLPRGKYRRKKVNKATEEL